MQDNNPDLKPEEVTVDTPVEETPDYSYDEVHKPTTAQIVKNEELPKEEPKKEEPKVEEPKVEEPKEEDVEVDPKEMAKEIAEEVAKNLKEATPEKKEETKDAYELFFEKTKAEKGRDPNWIEVSKFIQEQTRESIKQEQLEAQKVDDERKEIERKSTEELTKRFNETLDEELKELYTKGELTPIKDKSNPNDQGVMERNSLFQKMYDVNQERATKGQPPIMSISRIKYGYWEKPNAQPAGSDAPISMGHGSPASDDGEQELDYTRDVNKGWRSFHLPNLGRK